MRWMSLRAARCRQAAGERPQRAELGRPAAGRRPRADRRRTHRRSRCSRRFAAIGMRSITVDWRATLPSSAMSTYSDSAGGVAPASQRERVDPVVGQHRQLAPRHVDGRQASARHRVVLRAARNRQRRTRDVDADPRSAARQRRAPRTRRRFRSSSRRRSRTRARRPAGARAGRQRRVRGKFLAARKRVGQKAIEVIVVRRGYRALHAASSASGVVFAQLARARKRLPFERVLVRLVAAASAAWARTHPESMPRELADPRIAQFHASRFLRSTEASAALSASGGALRYRPFPLR